MMKYWTRFAATHNPNYEAGFPWQPFNDPTRPGVRLVLDKTLSQTEDGEANCDLWDEVGYDLSRIFPD